MQINNEAREALLAEVTGIPDELLNKIPAEGEWSIAQILEHLYLMESAVAKTVSTQLQAGEATDIPDKPIELTVDRSTKVVAPSFVTPGNGFTPFEDLKKELAVSHSALMKVAREASESELRAHSYTHPVFGEVNLKQWIPFVGYHEMRHTDQIRDVKRKLSL